MNLRLETGLMRLAELMADEREPWWIIGSTAMVLAGIAGVEPDDIDVVGDGTMLRRVLAKAGLSEVIAKPHAQFRSSPYARIQVEGSTDIEMQGDLELWENGAWQRLAFASREVVSFRGAQFFVPELQEQAMIFRRFGRAKDVAKAGMIDVFGL